MLCDKDTRKNTRTKLCRKVEKTLKPLKNPIYMSHTWAFWAIQKGRKDLYIYIYIYNQYKFANVTFIGLRGQHFQSHNQPLTTF